MASIISERSVREFLRRFKLRMNLVLFGGLQRYLVTCAPNHPADALT